MGGDRPAADPQGNRYDVVVIGSGPGGLTAAALLSHAGMRVLLAEQGSGAGGYAHGFQRGEYEIDPAIHLLPDPDLFGELLAHLGVRDRCEFIDVDTLHTVDMPGLRLAARIGSHEALVESHAEAMPEHRKEVRAFFKLVADVHREAHEMPAAVGLGGIEDAQDAAPTLFRYRRASVRDVVEEVFPDLGAGMACGIGGCIFGLPPARTPFMTFAQYVAVHLTAGAFYFEGGVQKFVDAMVAALKSSGGELLVKTPVDRIVIEDGRVAGVELEGGRRVDAPVVVSNAAAFETFGRLILEEDLPGRLVKKLSRMKVSRSAFIAYVGTSYELKEAGLSHMTFSTPDQDVDAGHDRLWLYFMPTLVDDSLAPSGYHVLSAVLMVPYDVGRPWEDEEPQMRSKALDALEGLCPGIGGQLEFVETATPVTLERYTRNTGGAVYGWESTLAHTGSKRPAQDGPIPGLYLAGHWTRPGEGALRSVVSGIQASRMVMQAQGSDDPDLQFQHRNLPPLVAR